MKKHSTEIEGVYILEPDVYPDERGHFMESFSYRHLTEVGITSRIFVQGNESLSHRLVLRGMHYQLKRPQAKLCWVCAGEVIDVIADIRVGSPTYGKVVHVPLSASTRQQIYIPRGCAHGFIALTQGTVFNYLCDEYYDPYDSSGIIWNDPQLAISWKTTSPIVSPKDAALRKMSDIPTSELPQYHPE